MGKTDSMLNGVLIVAVLFAVGCAAVEYVGNSFDPTINVDIYYSEDDSKRGWNTNTKTRPLMVDDLADAVDNGHMAGVINDTQFWRECPTFVRQPNGKYAATEGKNGQEGDHDDTIMGIGVGYQIRTAATQVPREDWDDGGLLG